MLNIVLLLGALAAAAETPFWKSKEKVYERIREGEVIVSVKSEAGPKGEAAHRLRVRGGGQVRAPRDFVFKKALEFENLVKVSDYIRRAKYDAPEQKLALEMGAFGYDAKMTLKLKVDESAKRVGYEVIDGSLTGMTGEFEFVEVGGEKTDVGILSDYPYEKLGFPAFFAEFGFEVIFQRLAVNLRSHVENEYRKLKVPQ